LGEISDQSIGDPSTALGKRGRTEGAWNSAFAPFDGRDGRHRKRCTLGRLDESRCQKHQGGVAYRDHKLNLKLVLSLSSNEVGEAFAPALQAISPSLSEVGRGPLPNTKASLTQ
jgi:hypothetical protein